MSLLLLQAQVSTGNLGNGTVRLMLSVTNLNGDPVPGIAIRDVYHTILTDPFESVEISTMREIADRGVYVFDLVHRNGWMPGTYIGFLQVVLVHLYVNKPQEVESGQLIYKFNLAMIYDQGIVQISQGCMDQLYVPDCRAYCLWSNWRL
jgi:hypothetical protein